MLSESNLPKKLEHGVTKCLRHPKPLVADCYDGQWLDVTANLHARLQLNFATSVAQRIVEKIANHVV